MRSWLERELHKVGYISSSYVSRALAGAEGHKFESNSGGVKSESSELEATFATTIMTKSPPELSAVKLHCG